MKDFTIPTHNICPRSISFSLEDGKIYNIKFAGGCPGNTKAIQSSWKEPMPSGLLIFLKEMTAAGKGPPVPTSWPWE